MDNADKIAVGIDLGTTNTVVSYMKRGKQTFLRFKGSGNMLPSVIYVEEDGSISVGKDAQNARTLDSRNGISSAKTYMGTDQEWTCRGKKFTPTQVATEVLKAVKARLIDKLSLAPDTVIQAVITVPAEFSANQIDETRKAGVAAGLEVVRIITEPMAAAVAAAKDNDANAKILVVDFGGGTFDLSLLQSKPQQNKYEALATGGDRRLGGDQFDKVLEDYFIYRINDDIARDMSTPESSLLEESEYWSMRGTLHDLAVKAKIALSEETETKVKLNNLFNYGSETYSFNFKLKREKFDQLVSSVYDKVDGCIQAFIKKLDTKGLRASDVTEIILAGGSCNVPHVRRLVEDVFGRSVNTYLDLDTLVAAGAGLVADHETTDGLEKAEFIENISHSLGIEVDEHGKPSLSKILLEGKPYPCTNTQLYSTVSDNQTAIDLNVYEATDENNPDISIHELYGSMTMEGIAPAPRGVPKIAVTFSFDKSRVLMVTARNLMGTPFADATNEDINERLAALSKEELEKYNAASEQLRIAMARRKKLEKRARQKPYDIMLLIDSSDSMDSRGAMTQAKQASNVLVDDMIDTSLHRLGILSFGSDVHQLLELSQDKTRMHSAINSIRTDGLTNMIDALRMAKSMLDGSKNNKAIIMVTDGYPCPASDDQTVRVANSVRRSGIKIFTIGAGGGVDLDFLQRMADPGCAQKIDSMSELNKAFEVAMQKITSLG